jgi:hypothetical protein
MTRTRPYESLNDYNVAISLNATSYTVSFDAGFYFSDANYSVMVSGNWDGSFYVTNKSQSGFTINFTAAPASATLDWVASHS